VRPYFLVSVAGQRASWAREGAVRLPGCGESQSVIMAQHRGKSGQGTAMSGCAARNGGHTTNGSVPEGISELSTASALPH